MDEKIEKLMLCSGMAILPWLTIGIAIAISLNPEYLFPHDVLSELGANGSSTEFISPAINNYPVGFLFIMFGVGIASRMREIALGFASGALIVMHGLGSIMAGAFSCEAGCPLFSTAIEQMLHTLAGVSMFGSLTLACLAWWLVGKQNTNFRRFGMFSLTCAAVSMVFLLAAFVGHILQTYAGALEAVSYASLCLWCFGLSLFVQKSDNE